MPKARTKSKPPIKAAYWKIDGKLYYVEREDLENAIRASGYSDEALKRKMCAGYSDLQQALAGERISGWAAYFIECSLEKREVAYSW
jgi:hypothetical protein